MGDHKVVPQISFTLLQHFKLTKQIFITSCVAFTIALYFIFYALFGDKGVVKFFILKIDLKKKELIKQALENKMEDKQNMVNGMSADSLDLDLLDEQARKDLGYAKKSEIVIYQDDKKP
jgi:cell division protein FtsB